MLRFLHTKNPWKKRVHVRTAPQRNPCGDRMASDGLVGYDVSRAERGCVWSRWKMVSEGHC
ncbi:hypothetical protein [Ruminococcus sp. 5_1_39BFAA]|uniref:hypothetical protein n=1 Tax=Ruminococcus sp. 5_1_39BFAA TaxID=457412 RepID=UPI0035691BF1